MTTCADLRRHARVLVLGMTVACNTSTTPSSDCPPSPASSITITIDGAPATVTPGSFTVTATGSRGDTPALQGSESGGVVTFSGTGQTSETYAVVVTYDGSVVYQAGAPWSAAGCGFVVSLTFGAWQDGGADAGS